MALLLLISLALGERTPAIAARKVKAAVRNTSAPERIAARWMKSMTLRDEVAQLVVIPFSGRLINPRSREFRNYVRLAGRVGVGGLILVNVHNGRLMPHAEPLAVASFLNKIQNVARIPLLVAGDFERGASMRVDATTPFPHAMAFTAGRDTSAARYEGEVT
ncbi:MAG: hypothetical protein M3Z85_22280, partial [Acidobacteriota bacterium]|nr:hypothetical protein [Acidobacteriota bacterium]